MRGAALAAALAAAALLPGKPLGAGVVVVAALVAVAVVLAAGASRDLLLFGSLAIALAVPALLLDATWVVALDLGAACVLATAAVRGPRLSSLAAPLVRLADAPALLPAAPRGLPSPCAAAFSERSLPLPSRRSSGRPTRRSPSSGARSRSRRRIHSPDRQRPSCSCSRSPSASAWQRAGRSGGSFPGPHGGSPSGNGGCPWPS